MFTFAQVYKYYILRYNYKYLIISSHYLGQGKPFRVKVAVRDHPGPHSSESIQWLLTKLTIAGRMRAAFVPQEAEAVDQSIWRLLFYNIGSRSSHQTFRTKPGTRTGNLCMLLYN